MKAIRQIQFQASLTVGATALSSVFGSLPREGEQNAWLSQDAARQYCEHFATERADVGDYFRPSVPTEGLEEGVTTIVTPTSKRPVHYWPEEELWTVDFPGGSVHQAGAVLTSLPPGTEVTNIAIGDKE